MLAFFAMILYALVAPFFNLACMSANAHARPRLGAKPGQVPYLGFFAVDYAPGAIKKQETGAKSVPVSNVTRLSHHRDCYAKISCD